MSAISDYSKTPESRCDDLRAKIEQLQKDKAGLQESNKVLVKELKEVKSNIHRFRGFSIEECNNYQYKIGNIILANEQEVKDE